MTRIKICGITRQEDAELAIQLGASALGFVFEPTSPRCLDPNRSDLSWIGRLSPYTVTVEVYGVSRPNPLSHLFSAVQSVHWAHELEPWQRRIHAVRPTDHDLQALLDAVPADSTALVLDAFSVDAYGGTGKAIDWGFAAEIVERSSIPTILAGGLNAANVGEAIRRVRPYGVDVSSGVESAPGIKDAAKMRAFISKVLVAFD